MSLNRPATEQSADTLEYVSRIAIWVVAGINSYAWYEKQSELWKWTFLALLVVSFIAVDLSSFWVPKNHWWPHQSTLQAASVARTVAWLSWFTAVAYTPLDGFEILWVVGGVAWGINALCIILYAFNDKFQDIFVKDQQRQKGRAIFRLVVHDVLAAAFVCVLGAAFGDVFDGDADDSHWRSMLSGAVIFQVFYAFWSHWSDLRVKKNEKCCGPSMRVVWKTITRFICFCTLFVVILTRCHEDRVLVDMGIDTTSYVVVLLACTVLAIINIDGVNRNYDV